MRLAIPAETAAGENRVAAVPESVPLLVKLGLEVLVHAGAGDRSLAYDQAYRDAGALVLDAAEFRAALGSVQALACVQPPAPELLALLPIGALTVSFLLPAGRPEVVLAAADAHLSAMSFELVPRISRAQSMDALTSQAFVAGYRAALVAAELCPKFFPMFTTAAGTIRPARVLVLGAGVAGLQAIATAKRIGGLVSAYDVRPASADEVRSMGAKFIDLGLDALEGSGGYAREMGPDRAKAQQDALAPFLAASDVVITTAAVPGRPAPRLVTEEMLDTMSPGAVVVDLAAETGGNVAGSVAGQLIERKGVRIWGARDVASQLPVSASSLYARNVVQLLGVVIKGGEVILDVNDEIVAGCLVTHQGQVRHPLARAALGLDSAPTVTAPTATAPTATAATQTAPNGEQG